MSIFTILSLLCTLSLAAVLPRTNTVPDGYCCFTLQANSGATVQENRQTGVTYLSAGQQSGWYCIDLSNTQNILYDDKWNACYLAPNSELQSVGQFKCLDGTIGPNSWTITSGHYLAHDSSISWKACPNTSGSGKLLYGQSSASGCVSTHLKVTGLQGTCGSLTA